MFIKMILARAYDNVIGLLEDGKHKLPWNIPEDMDLFYYETKDKVVVMGNNTYQDLPQKAINNFKHILVLSREAGHSNAKVTFVSSVAQALTLAEQHDKEELIVCGGASVYELFAPIADELIVTTISRYMDNPKCVKVSENIFKRFKMAPDTYIQKDRLTQVHRKTEYPQWQIAERSQKREIYQVSKWQLA